MKEALPFSRGVLGKQGRQLGGQPRRPRAQLDKPGGSLVVCKLERPIEQRCDLPPANRDR